MKNQPDVIEWVSKAEQDYQDQSKIALKTMRRLRKVFRDKLGL